jgi:hypothetical protein
VEPDETPLTAEQKRVRQLGLAVLGWCLALYGVFVWPFRFPGKIPTFSHSYIAGYSNRAAAITAVGLALAIFVLSWRLFRNLPPRAGLGSTLPPKYLYMCASLYAVTVAGLSYLAMESPYYYGEARYFLLRLDRMLNGGEVPYRQFDFAYGWLQLYLPAGIYSLARPLHASLEFSYYATVMLMMLGGLTMLYRMVNSRVLDIGPKRSVFILTALAMLNVTLGLNYTPVRFLAAPYLLMLLYSEVLKARELALPIAPIRIIAVTGLSSILVWSLSPEAGIAYSAASAFLLLILSTRRDRWLLCGIPFCAVGCLTVLALFGRSYLGAILDFGAGMGSFLVVPAPYMVFFLITLICLVPVGLAMAVRNDSKSAPLLLSLGAMGLAYVSAAMGRCDPGHVLWNGICIFLLGFAFVGKYYRAFQSVYLTAFGLLFVFGLHLGIDLTYMGQLRRLTAPRMDSIQNPGVDLRRLESLDLVAVPFSLDKRTETYLSSHSKLAHDPFVEDWVWDQKSLDKKLKGIATSSYVLADLDHCCFEDPAEMVELIMLYPLKYQPRNKPFSTGEHLRTFVESNFERIERMGSYTLYRNRLPTHSVR